jgi:hypothetical protein
MHRKSLPGRPRATAVQSTDAREQRMKKISPPEYRFSVERRSDLVKLGVNKTQIAELERTLPVCKLRITDKSPLQDVRDKLKPIQKAFSEICTAIAGLKYYAGTNPAAREALNRLQMAANDDTCSAQRPKLSRCRGWTHSPLS